MRRVGRWLTVVALLAAGGCDRPSGESGSKAGPETMPTWDYSGWVWIHAMDDSYRFAAPPGSRDPLVLDRKPMESTPANPYRTGGFLNVETPCGHYLIFSTMEESDDLSDPVGRAFLRGGLYYAVGAEDVSEGKLLPRQGGTAVQYICKCKQDPLGFRNGGPSTAVVRVVQAGGTVYMFNISAPDARYDESRAAQILDSFRLTPGSK